MNGTFTTIPVFNLALRRVLSGENRSEFNEEEKAVLDAYLISVTNLYEQIFREILEGVIDPDAYEYFGGKGLLRSQYYKTSWPVYRRYLSEKFNDEFENIFNLDPSIEANL